MFHDVFTIITGMDVKKTTVVDDTCGLISFFLTIYWVNSLAFTRLRQARVLYRSRLILFRINGPTNTLNKEKTS